MVDRAFLERAARLWADRDAQLESLRETRNRLAADGPADAVAHVDRIIERWEASPPRSYEEVLAHLVERYGDAESDTLSYSPVWGSDG